MKRQVLQSHSTKDEKINGQKILLGKVINVDRKITRENIKNKVTDHEGSNYNVNSPNNKNDIDIYTSKKTNLPMIIRVKYSFYISSI